MAVAASPTSPSRPWHKVTSVSWRSARRLSRTRGGPKPGAISSSFSTATPGANSLGTLASVHARAYPIDEYEETGITRLQAYSLAKQSILDLGILSKGAFWASDAIGLRMASHPNFELPQPDVELTQRLRSILGDDAGRYGISLLDFTDPSAPVFAEINGSQQQNPGSVGKLLVLLTWFQTLADVYPDDIETRFRIMAETQITANAFTQRAAMAAFFL